jgi:F0F1-type ATP synthase assembly protein I
MTSTQNIALDEETSIKEEAKTPNSADGISLLAHVSSLAWNLVTPIVGGALLGSYLDKRNGDNVSWTISLLALGVMIAFGNLYNLYIDQSHKKQNQKTDDSNGEE